GGGPMGAGGGKPEDLFGELDTDGNGSISQDELTSALGEKSDVDSSELFAALDNDGDGSLSVEESAALAPPPPPPGGMGGPRGAGGDSEELFGQLDADGNGSVSQDELNTLFGQSNSSSGGSSTSGSDQDVYAKLVASLLKQYESSTTAYTTRVGSQLSTAA
ncbi:EF-hand domain-containing protein, partial [Metapseudomonas otitidis]|uniref:EF-hand domain-containing protein n=1 Tax=Metapseudomonas otitidis TaxID=319939 RepID=UPI00197D046A